MRITLLAFLVPFIAGANAREAHLPIPPIPPAHKPPMAAPLPDLDIRVPLSRAGQATFTLDTDINHRTTPAVGLGFAPGAHYQIDNDRRFSLPGLMMHLPFP